jgi:hypothetical protein
MSKLKQVFETLGIIIAFCLGLAELMAPFVIFSNLENPIAPYLAWFFVVNFMFMAWLIVCECGSKCTEDSRATLIFISSGWILILLGAIIL